MSTQRACILLAVSLLLLASAPAAGATDWGPWDTPALQPSVQPVDFSPLDLALRGFQKYISPIDGARCQMYPTCSAYAREALHKHGALLGIFLTVDRLLHETDPSEQQTPIVKWGTRRYYDPLVYNDFWLDKQE